MSGAGAPCYDRKVKCGCKKECSGLLGKLFGHNFRRYLVKEKYKQTPYVSFDIHGGANVMAFLESQRDVYVVRCKRCGSNAEI